MIKKDSPKYLSGVNKRWGLDMDMGYGGDMGSMDWTVNNYDDEGNNAADEDDARKIFRFGKRASPVKKWAKKWSMEDDLSMALPWEMDGSVMSDEDRAGGKIFRFGKRSGRSSGMLGMGAKKEE